MSFNSVTEWLAVHEQDLSVDAREISHADALTRSSFVLCLQLLELWHDMPGTPPHHNNIKPHKLPPKLLPILFILDVEFEDDTTEPDFRWRLFGTAIRDRYGMEATGHLLSKAIDVDASIPESLRLARKTLATLQPHFMLTDFKKLDQVKHCASTVLMPLSGDSGKTERLFGCTDWLTPKF